MIDFQDRPWRLALLLWLLTAVLALASMAVGPVPIGLGAALDALASSGDRTAAIILLEIRLPRTLLAVLIGAALGMAGAALQGLLRNPLAEPGVIGVSGGAGLGAVVVFYSGLATDLPMALPLGGMAGAVLAVSVLFALAGLRGGVLTLVLAGVAVNSFAAALTSLALNLSPNPFAVTEIVFWLLGSISDRGLDHVALAAPFVLAGLGLLALSMRSLDALALGEDTARSLGINLTGTQILIVAGTTLAVGASVSVSGAIGFIGLVVPHLLRPLVGYRPGALLAVSAPGGAALLLAADIVVRLLPTTQELKLGVVTALVGAPFFLALVLRTRRMML